MGEAFSRRRSFDSDDCIWMGGFESESILLVLVLVLVLVIVLVIGDEGSEGDGAMILLMRVVAVRDMVSVTSSARARMRWGTME